MVPLMIVLVVLVLLFIYSIIAHASTRLSFLEKQAEIIDFIDVHDDFDSPKIITGYKPVIRFEVEGKIIQGIAHVFPAWKNKEKKILIILYNPQNPEEFNVKESSSSPASGCIFAIITIITLAITIYFYSRSK